MHPLNPRIIYSSRYLNLINAVFKINNLQVRGSGTSLKYKGDKPFQLEDTLTGRSLLYLNSKKSINNDKIKNVRKQENLDYQNLDNLNNLNEDKVACLDVDEIIECLECLKLHIQMKSSLNHRFYLNIIDKECCKRVDKLSPFEILNILHAYTIACSRWILQNKFYDLAIENVINNLFDLDTPDIIQLMFFIGLEKKRYKSQIRSLQCLRRLYNEATINNLNGEELSIICTSIFKTGLKLDKFPKFLEKIHHFINNNVNIVNDPSLFIPFVKTIRQNRFQNDDLMGTISCSIFFNKAINNYNFKEMCHIMALFADYYYYDKAIFDNFTKKCLQELKNTTISSDNNKNNSFITDELRSKDIHRFLWCLCTINYKFNEILNENDIRDTIIPNIIERIKRSEFSKNVGMLTEIFLYLWMLNYRAKELVPYIFTDKYINIIRAFPGPSKQRLNNLLAIIYYEDRPLFKQLGLKTEGRNEYNLENQINRRPVLQRVFSALNSLKRQTNISKFEMNLAVPYLNVVGIIGYNNIYKSVFIEVLDEFTTLKNVDEGKVIPTGLMQTKLRIINGFEEGFVVVNAIDIESMTEAQLEKYLLDEINLVC